MFIVKHKRRAIRELEFIMNTKKDENPSEFYL